MGPQNPSFHGICFKSSACALALAQGLHSKVAWTPKVLAGFWACCNSTSDTSSLTVATLLALYTSLAMVLNKQNKFRATVS